MSPHSSKALSMICHHRRGASHQYMEDTRILVENLTDDITGFIIGFTL
jgi:hypothetical protein